MSVRILVLTPYRTLQGFHEFQASRHLLAALDARTAPAMAWELRQPWLKITDAELSSFDAVLCWTYRHTWGDHLRHAAAIERRCAALGIPFVNSPLRFTYLHSPDLLAWAEHGVSCAACQRFERPEEIRLAFPLVLRRDSEHRGRRMFRVESPEEVEEICAREAAVVVAGTGKTKPLDLAAEFVDTRWPDGFYRKRRAYVAGGEVIPAHSVRSEHWIVNFGARADNLGSYKEDKRFLESGEERADLVRRAAEAIGTDLAALDYSPAPDGSYVFWEANRNPRMWGDAEVGAGKPRASDLRLGEAMVDLILRRIEERAGCR
jgi:hypothetical protein